jgi:hypothetical protein
LVQYREHHPEKGCLPHLVEHRPEIEDKKADRGSGGNGIRYWKGKVLGDRKQQCVKQYQSDTDQFEHQRIDHSFHHQCNTVFLTIHEKLLSMDIFVFRLLPYPDTIRIRHHCGVEMKRKRINGEECLEL